MNMRVELQAYDKFDLRLLALADKFERRNVHFNLAQWATPHGCPSCIAGHLAWESFEGLPDSYRRRTFNEWQGKRPDEFRIAAREWAGIDGYEMRDMFLPNTADLFGDLLAAAGMQDEAENFDIDNARRSVSPKWAAAMLRHYVATGRVDWPATRPVGEKLPDWIDGLLPVREAA